MRAGVLVAMGDGVDVSVGKKKGVAFGVAAVWMRLLSGVVVVLDAGLVSLTWAVGAVIDGVIVAMSGRGCPDWRETLMWQSLLLALV